MPKRRVKNMLPNDRTKRRRFVKRELRSSMLKNRDIEVQIALWRVEHGTRPSLGQLVIAAIKRVYPDPVKRRRIFNSRAGAAWNMRVGTTRKRKSK